MNIDKQVDSVGKHVACGKLAVPGKKLIVAGNLLLNKQLVDVDLLLSICC